jgi:hypothetical protein
MKARLPYHPLRREEELIMRHASGCKTTCLCETQFPRVCSIWHNKRWNVYFMFSYIIKLPKDLTKESVIAVSNL